MGQVSEYTPMPMTRSSNRAETSFQATQQEPKTPEKSNKKKAVIDDAKVTDEKSADLDDSQLTPEERRAKQNGVYELCYRIIINPWFNFVIYTLIFLSSLTIALYTYDQP